MSEFPKIIHQIIYSYWDRKVPIDIQNRMNNWTKFHPNYEHIIWNKKKSRNFIKQYYDWFLVVYDTYAYEIQRSDAIKYFILYHYGGICCDINLSPIKSIIPLLEKYRDKNTLLYKSNTGLISTDFMVSKPLNPFWKKIWYELILNCKYKTSSKQLISTFTTGSLFLDNAYETYSLKNKHVKILNSKYINDCEAKVKPCFNEQNYLKRYTSTRQVNFSYFNKPIIIIGSVILIILSIFFVRSITTTSTIQN